MSKKKKSRASKRSKALKKQSASAANKRQADVNIKVAEKKADKLKKDTKMPMSDLLKIFGVFAVAAVMLVVGLWAFKAAERHSILSERNEISSAGIDSYLEADVNGIKQYVHIRGQNRNMPMLLIFPDYPGYLCASSDYLLGSELESYFTVVTWDMRGTGQTEVLNAQNGIDSGSEFTYTDIADDAQGICDFVRSRLSREDDRFIVLGYSWGSAAAADFARRYSGYVSAYIGVSQIADLRLGISSGLMDEAQNRLRDGSVEQFNDYVEAVKLVNAEEETISADALRIAAQKLGAGKSGPTLYDIEVSPFCESKAYKAFKTAPKRTDAYLRSIGEFNGANFTSCLALVNFQLIYGENDCITPVTTAEPYLGSSERISRIEGAGHELLFENFTETADIIRKMVYGS